jgi:hypothetical protein
MPDPLATSLDRIRELITARDHLTSRTDWSNPVSVAEFNAAQDKLAARVPSLLAAIDAARKLHQPMVRRDGWHPTCSYDNHRWPCPESRDISAALLGPQQGEETT